MKNLIKSIGIIGLLTMIFLNSIACKSLIDDEKIVITGIPRIGNMLVAESIGNFKYSFEWVIYYDEEGNDQVCSSNEEALSIYLSGKNASEFIIPETVFDSIKMQHTSTEGLYIRASRFLEPEGNWQSKSIGPILP